jgi:hypothetical protein
MYDHCAQKARTHKKGFKAQANPAPPLKNPFTDNPCKLKINYCDKFTEEPDYEAAVYMRPYFFL